MRGTGWIVAVRDHLDKRPLASRVLPGRIGARGPPRDVRAIRTGDVDFIAGPMPHTFSDAEWEERLLVELRKRPRDPACPELHEGFAHLEAALDGCIEWPPTVDLIAACKFKARTNASARRVVAVD